jgi:hypothetical protein
MFCLDLAGKGEARRLEKEIALAQQEIESLTEAQNERQNQIFKSQQTVDRIKQEVGRNLTENVAHLCLVLLSRMGAAEEKAFRLLFWLP